MQHRRTDFARQVNEHSLGFLGDPERWGGTQQISVPLFSRVEPGIQPKPVRTGQLIRAQVDSLAAVPWQIVASAAWRKDPRDVATGVRLLLFIAIEAGVGQVMHRLIWDVTESAAYGTARQGADVLYPQFATGQAVGDYAPGIASHLFTPIPAAALSASALLAATYESAEFPPDPIPVEVTLTCCPVAIPGWNL